MNQIAKNGWVTKVRVKFGGSNKSHRARPLATKAGVTKHRRKTH